MVIVVVSYLGQIDVHYYKSLCRPRYRPVMQDVWCSSLEPYLRKWYTDSRETCAFPVPTEKWILHPHQTDGSSYGIMAIVQVYSHLKSSFAFQQYIVDAEHVRVMSLQILWMLMCKSEVQHPEQ